MNKIVLACVCLISISAFSQQNIVDVTIDGKPAKMNTTTGVYTFTNGAPSSYTSQSNTQIESAVEKMVSETDVKVTGDSTLHTVSKGETLYSISKKYQISMAQIKSLNNLDTNVLSVNQKLKIGYNTSAEIKEVLVYTVAKGDTLYRIAKASNLSVQELKELNNLENNNISIGQELKLK